MTIKARIKDLEQMEAAIAKEKKALLAAEKKQTAAEAKLETLFKQSGFDKPRDLVEALIEKYGLRGLGKKRKSAASRAVGKKAPVVRGGRRRRTKITPQIRDAVKKAVAGGSSKNAVSHDMKISYAVITKIVDGKYDKV